MKFDTKNKPMVSCKEDKGITIFTGSSHKEQKGKMIQMYFRAYHEAYHLNDVAGLMK